MNKEYIKIISEILSEYKKIDYVFIFGSVLKKSLSDSDIDILVKADLSIAERIDLSPELGMALKKKAEVVFAKDVSCGIILNALSKGMPLLINNRGSLKSDYLKNFYIYEDTNQLRELRISRIKRRF